MKKSPSHTRCRSPFQGQQPACDQRTGARRRVTSAAGGRCFCPMLFSSWFVACLLSVQVSVGQNNSLYQLQDSQGRSLPLTMQQASLIYSEAPEVRTFRPHDIIQVRVDEMARMTSEGRADQRRNASYNAILNNWIRLNGFKRLERDQMEDGPPQVRGGVQELYRAESGIETTERLTLNIASRVVDIRPNGTLVIEGHKEVRINDQVWKVSLTGLCRQDDIGRDNTITSDRVIDFRLSKHEAGATRDGYRRGWFKRHFDRWTPF